MSTPMQQKPFRFFLGGFLALSLAFAGCGGDDDKKSIEEEESLTAKDQIQKVTGQVVDGYIKNARLKIAAVGKTVQEPIYVNGVNVFDGLTTDTNGSYSVYVPNDGRSYVIKAKGGVDKSSNKTFESILKTTVDTTGTEENATAVVMINKRAYRATELEEIFLTPMTTLVTSVVESGKSKSEAEQKIATSLGVSTNFLRSDPVKAMKTGSQADRAAAATAWNKGYTVMKMVESYSKAVASGDDEDLFEEVAAEMLNSVAELMDEGKTLDEIADAPETLVQKAAGKIAANETVAQKVSAEKIALVEKKLTVVADTTKEVFKTLAQTDMTKFTEEGADVDQLLQAKSTAVETVTNLYEGLFSSMADADDDTALDETIQTKVNTGATKITEEFGNGEILEETIGTKIKEAVDAGTELDEDALTELVDQTVQQETEETITQIEEDLGLDLTGDTGTVTPIISGGGGDGTGDTTIPTTTTKTTGSIGFMQFMDRNLSLENGLARGVAVSSVDSNYSIRFRVESMSRNLVDNLVLTFTVKSLADDRAVAFLLTGISITKAEASDGNVTYTATVAEGAKIYMQGRTTDGSGVEYVTSSNGRDRIISTDGTGCLVFEFGDLLARLKAQPGVPSSILNVQEEGAYLYSMTVFDTDSYQAFLLDDQFTTLAFQSLYANTAIPYGTFYGSGFAGMMFVTDLYHNEIFAGVLAGAKPFDMTDDNQTAWQLINQAIADANWSGVIEIAEATDVGEDPYNDYEDYADYYACDPMYGGCNIIATATWDGTVDVDLGVGENENYTLFTPCASPYTCTDMALDWDRMEYVIGDESAALIGHPDMELQYGSGTIYYSYQSGSFDYYSGEMKGNPNGDNTGDYATGNSETITLTQKEGYDACVEEPHFRVSLYKYSHDYDPEPVTVELNISVGYSDVRTFTFDLNASNAYRAEVDVRPYLPCDGTWSDAWNFYDTTVSADCPAQATAGVDINGHPVCYLDKNISDDMTLTSDTYWGLTGETLVVNGAKLTIQAGTTVIGMHPEAWLGITKDATIYAAGTSLNPILFTSLADLYGYGGGQGEWGGLVLFGHATTNMGAIYSEVDSSLTGGHYTSDSTANDADGSGTLQYAVIRGAGGTFYTTSYARAVASQVELNGLTLIGVGDGTAIDHISIVNSGDDGLDISGGTVDLHHIYIFNVADDAIDVSYGYRGSIQNLFVDQNGSGNNTGYLVESDSYSSSDAGSPATKLIVSNFTMSASSNGGPVNLRTGSDAVFLNGMITYLYECFYLEDNATWNQLTDSEETYAFRYVLCGSSFDSLGVMDYNDIYVSSAVYPYPSSTQIGAIIETPSSAVNPSTVDSGLMNYSYVGADDPNDASPWYMENWITDYAWYSY